MLSCHSGTRGGAAGRRRRERYRAHQGRDGTVSMFFGFGCARGAPPFACVYHSRVGRKVLDGMGANKRRLPIGGEA